MKSIAQMFDMSDQKVLITGGGTGLGKGFAQKYLEAGADVMLAARRLDVLTATTEELNNLDFQGKASCVQLDVSSVEAIKASYQYIDDWGVANVLVNNAGVVNAKTIMDVSEEECDAVQDVNFKGPLMLSREFVRRLLDLDVAPEHGSSIINISSILGLSTLPGSAIYGSTKASLIHLTKTMALEWSRFDIRVNAICPGYINTDMSNQSVNEEFASKLYKQIPQRRFGEIEEVCGAALLLASPASRYMTGSVLTIDGGHSIPKII